MRRATHPMIILFSYIFALFLLGCDTEDPWPDDQPRIQPGKGVFIINEGNFQWGNASLSFYDKERDTIFHHLYRNANQEYLGDLLQSMYIHDDKAYLVVNNSRQIKVVDLVSTKYVATIPGMTSPRYMASATNGKAYVSDLFAGEIYVINTATDELTGSIPVNGWTEEIMRLGDHIVTTGVQSGQLYAIDPETDQIVDSLSLTPGPVSMVTDKFGHLWVLAGGSPFFKTPPSLYQVDRDNFQVRRTEALPNPDIHYSRLSICHLGETLYFLGGNVFRFDLTSPDSQPGVHIEADGRMFYSLGVDPYNGDIYVTDAVDFTQNGHLLRFSDTGELLSTQPTSIIPGSLTFY